MKHHIGARFHQRQGQLLARWRPSEIRYRLAHRVDKLPRRRAIERLIGSFGEKCPGPRSLRSNANHQPAALLRRQSNRARRYRLHARRTRPGHRLRRLLVPEPGTCEGDDPEPVETVVLPTLPELLFRCSRFRSARSSAADWQRRSRSFSSVLFRIFSNSTGSCAFSVIGATGGWFRMWSKTTAVVVPVNGCCPVAISYKTTPSENTSPRASSASPRACSGDI